MSVADQVLIARNAEILVTMDADRREIKDGAVVSKNGVVQWVGASAEIPREWLDHPQVKFLDMRGQVVLPGLINTHHHMCQSLTRAVPAAQNAELFDWLSALYPIWAGLTPEMIRVSTLTAMAELLMSGCTTTSDHLYIYPNGCRLDDAIMSAQQIGMRFHAARGSMSVGRSKGGLPPDSVVEDESFILTETQRLIESWHDPRRHSMLRLVVAPCSPFTVSNDLMLESAKLARHYKVSMHTHLAENDSDVVYSQEKYNMTPAQYAEHLGWVGPDVWHAHCVKLDAHGIDLFARTGTGIAHCPCSNMRLASGIAPIRTMRDAGVKVGLGVDGSASNDAAHLLGEARQAMLLQRVGFGPTAMGAREALEIATLGGASVLGRDDIGALAPNMSADFVAFDVTLPAYAGADHDLVAALVFCTPSNTTTTVVNGKVIVEQGRITTLDLMSNIAVHRKLALELANKARHG